jgi:hypothetical protein
VTRALAPLLLACVALAACGGGGGADSKEDAEQTVRDFVRATNQRDADRFCEDVVSQEFLEETTGAKGDQALEACKQQLKQLKGLKVKLVRIDKAVVDGDKARVTAVLETQGQAHRQLLRLKQEDGRWKIAGGSGN